VTTEQIESIARKAHYVSISHLSPAILKDPNRDWYWYWDVMTEEFKEPWRQIVRLVAEEMTNQNLGERLGEVIGTRPDGQPIVRYPAGQ
jgi:hypothetical protein